MILKPIGAWPMLINALKPDILCDGWVIGTAGIIPAWGI
jgi:hypothetical protein